MKKITIIIIVIIIAVLSTEIVLSWPMEKTEVLGIYCIGSDEYQLMPGVNLLRSVTVRKFLNYDWSDPIVFHSYGDRQDELAKLEVNKKDATFATEMWVPAWFEVKYVEAGIFPFKEKQVMSVVTL